MAMFNLFMYGQVAQYEGQGGFLTFSANGEGEYHSESERDTFKGTGLRCNVPGPGQILEDFNTWSEHETAAVYDEGQANLKERNHLLQEGVSKVEAMVDPSAPTDAKAREDYKKLKQDMIDYEAKETPEQFAARCEPKAAETPDEAFRRKKEEWAAAASAKSDAAYKAEVDRQAGAADHIAQLERELGIKK